MKAPERRFATVALQLPVPASATILAVDQHQNSLVLGLNFTRILVIPMVISESGAVKLAQSKMHQLKMKEMSIASIKSRDDHCFVHLVGEKQAGGPVLDLTENFQKSACVDKCADHMGVDCTSGSLAVAVARETKVRVKVFEKRKWSERFSKDIQEKVLSIAVSTPNVYVATGSAVHVIDIVSGEVSTFKSESPTPPFVMAVSGDTFFSYSGSSALILDCNLSSNFPPFSFSEVATDHCYTGSFYASVVPNGVVVYNFARMKGFSYVEDARHVACYSGRLLVSTSRRVSLGVDVTELVDDILSGTEQSGNSYDLRLLLAVFDQFWQKGEKENALSMLKLTKFREALPDVLSLFESLELPELPERRLTVHPGAQDLEALRALSDVLIDIGDYKNMLANTAVVELLALIGDTERMEEYLDHVLESKILDDIVKDFLAKKSARTLGYYLRAMKQYSQALEIFKNTESVEDVKNTLIANGKDFDFVASNVGWIMERKPLIAIQVFADPRVSWADALKLGTEQYKSYYLAILRVIVLRKNVTRHAELVNKYCQEMIKIFSSLSQRDFDRSSVSFCTCVMNNPESTIDDISAEMIEQIILMVTQYTSSLDGVTKSMFDTVPNPSFRISLYKAAGEPEKAIDLLWRLNHDMQECESFCQGDPNLLIYLLGLAKADTPPQDLFARITTLVTNHITTLDVSRALSFIDGDTPISLVADFIRDCYSTLHKATITAQLQASFASSDAFETDYQVAKSSLPAIELDRNSVCSICNRHLGFTSIMRTPSGALCHQKCAPRDT